MRSYKSNHVRTDGFNPGRQQEIEFDFNLWAKQKYNAGPVSTDPDVIRTHGFMGKGLQISVERKISSIEEFYDKYVQATTGLVLQKICMDEKLSTPYFFNFHDLDMESSQPIEDKVMMDIVKTVVKTNSKFFPNLYNSKNSKDISTFDEFGNNRKKLNNLINQYSRFNDKTGEWVGAGTGRHRLRCMVSFPNEFEQERWGGTGMIPRYKEDGTVYYKHAAHLNYIGRLHMTVSQAKLTTAYIAQVLEQEHGKRQKENGENPWNSVVDSEVYKEAGQGGVRMLMSHKIKACKCKKTKKHKNSEFCGKCEDGWIWSNRRYWPKVILDADGEEDKNAAWIMQDAGVFVRAACIRTLASSVKKEWSQPKECRLKESDFEKAAKSKKSISSSLPKGKMKEKYANIGEYINPEGEIGQIIENTIKELEDQWNDIIVIKIFRQKEHRYLVYLENNGHWCLHKNDYHGGSQIWFVIVPNGIIQKCTSVKHECKKWESAPYHLQADLSELLFFDQLAKDPSFIRSNGYLFPEPEVSEEEEIRESEDSSSETFEPTSESIPKPSETSTDSSNSTSGGSTFNSTSGGTTFNSTNWTSEPVDETTDGDQHSEQQEPFDSQSEYQEKPFTDEDEFTCGETFFSDLKDIPTFFTPKTDSRNKSRGAQQDSETASSPEGSQEKDTPTTMKFEKYRPDTLESNTKRAQRANLFYKIILTLSSMLYPQETQAGLEEQVRNNHKVPPKRKPGYDDTPQQQDRPEEQFDRPRKTGNRDTTRDDSYDTNETDTPPAKRQRSSSSTREYVDHLGEKKTVDVMIHDFGVKVNTVMFKNSGIKWGCSM
jgi:hypothetical protein